MRCLGGWWAPCSTQATREPSHDSVPKTSLNPGGLSPRIAPGFGTGSQRRRVVDKELFLGQPYATGAEQGWHLGLGGSNQRYDRAVAERGSITMPKPRPRESTLYPVVEAYLKRRFGCFVTARNRGTRFGRLDVVGIRDTGRDLSGEFELIGVEVKAGYQPFSTSAGQAYGCSVFADRCYLADYRLGRQPFTAEETEIASALGVGLLALTRRRVTEILAAPQGKPIAGMRLELVEKLRFSLCTVCGTLFRRRGADTRSSTETSRAGLRRASRHDKGLVYWLPKLAERRKDSRAYLYQRRYVCVDCVTALTS